MFFPHIKHVFLAPTISVEAKVPEVAEVKAPEVAPPEEKRSSKKPRTEVVVVAVGFVVLSIWLLQY